MVNLNLAELMLGLLVLQQALAGLIWWVAGRAGVVLPRVSAYWTGASVLAAGCAALLLWGPHDGWAEALPNALLVLVFIWAGRGMEVLFEQPDRTHQALVLTLLSLVCGAVGWGLGWIRVWPTLYSSVISAIWMVHLARYCEEAAQRDLGPLARQLVTIPAWVLAWALGVRAVVALIGPGDSAANLSDPTLINLLGLLGLALMGLFLHLALGLTVAMRLVQGLQRLNLRDPLTGLGNRRALQESAAVQLARFERHGRAFAVVSLDIDHFKRVNDAWGHAVGDLALCHLATLLQAQLRMEDLAVRTGGEEFLLVLPETDLEAAQHLAERLRLTVASTPLVVSERALPLTISLGVAQARSGESLDALLERADAALYRAKHEGRNCVRLAQTPPPG